MDLLLVSLDGQSSTSTPRTVPTILDFNVNSTSPNMTTLNIGLKVIIGAAIAAVLYIRFISCDELLGAITFTNIALLTVGAAGFTGTIAYHQAGTCQ